MPNLVTGVHRDRKGAVVLVIHNSVAPTDQEWGTYVANIEPFLEVPNIVGLAITDGGVPNAAQRSSVNLLLGRRKGTALSAVVSSSIMLRAVITALRLVNPDTRGFKPAQIHEALGFLGFSRDRFLSLSRTIDELNQKLTPPSEDARRVLSDLMGGRVPAFEAS